MAESQGHQVEQSEDNRQAIQSARHSTQLCQACGVCCNGTLFSYVNTTRQEAEILKGTSVKTYPNKKGRPTFDLPCSALSGTSCSIYTKRPHVCRVYMCNLTRNVLNGREDIDVALDVVADIKAKTKWLFENVPAGLFEPQTPAPTKDKPPIDHILSAWKLKKEDVQTRESLEVEELPKSLWLFLTRLHLKFQEKAEKSELSDEDKDYIVTAFAFAKLCDRLFEKTALLGKYGQLVQRLYS